MLKPFLHTWSLSVEEQFYILFPIVLLVAFKYFRKYLIHILIFGFIISLGLAEWTSRNYPSTSFYFLHTRAWELLVGSILAYFEITLGHRSRNKTLNLILPSIGFFLIIFTIIFFKLRFLHPSLNTVPAIIGVCLIIWFSNKNELVTRVLSTNLFVGIGLISYSLYLWHYPIFAFSRINEFSQGSLFKKLLLGASIIILSVFSYYFVERPTRNKNNKFKVIISLILISISILVITNINIVKKDGYKDRIPEILQKNLLTEPWNLLKNLDGEYCHNNMCKFNILSNNKIYIIGDSHMSSLIFNLKERIVKKNYQFLTSTFSDCLFYPGFNLVNIKTMKKTELCNNDYFQLTKQNLSNERNSIIIFGGRLPVHLTYSGFDNQEGGVEVDDFSLNLRYFSLGTHDTIQSSFKDEISELSKNNKIILIYPIPEAGWDIPSKLLNILPKKIDLIKDYLIPKNYITTSYQAYKDRAKSSFELLDSIEGKNIYRVYPDTLFCNTIIKNRCVTHDDKNIFYADDDHLSIKGAEMVNNLIMKEIEKIENKSN